MPKHVLFADDDPGLRRLVERGLGASGIAVTAVADGKAALERLTQDHDFDVIALDLYMPGPDGLETLKHINALPHHPPVVIVTGAQDSRMAVAALKEGAFDYVVKDVQGEFVPLLKSALFNAVESMRLRRAKELAEAELREARDRFEALAAERQMLLREVNHRVGNSLQLIAAFLHLQASSADNPDVKDALTKAMRRVTAVAQVHKRLYTSDDVKSVWADQYLSTLVQDLNSDPDSTGLVTFESDKFELDPDRIVAIGIIVNELVVNAMKYAYPDGKGPIRLTLRCVQGRCVLTVEDDGIGYGPSATPGSTGLGRHIIAAMAGKLGTSAVYESKNPGTRTTFSFEL